MRSRMSAAKLAEVTAYVRLSHNGKLGKGVDATYAPIGQSCPVKCPMRKSRACYAMHGKVALTVRRLDDASRGMAAVEVARDEATKIDAAYPRRVPKGRMLRLHVSGDARTNAAARVLSLAAGRWLDRGGAAVWSYSHAWREVERDSWGRVSILASMESTKEGRTALKRGYAPAVVVESFPNGRKTFESNGVRWIPCPAQTSEHDAKPVLCSSCKLCTKAEWLHASGTGIAFEAHSGGRRYAIEQVRAAGKRSLPVLQ